MRLIGHIAHHLLYWSHGTELCKYRSLVEREKKYIKNFRFEEIKTPSFAKVEN